MSITTIKPHEGIPSSLMWMMAIMAGVAVANLYYCQPLQNMKEDLRLWVDYLYKAENNFDDITIRKLTFKNPTMKAKLDEAREANRIEEIKD